MMNDADMYLIKTTPTLKSLRFNGSLVSFSYETYVFCKWKCIMRSTVIQFLLYWSGIYCENVNAAISTQCNLYL